MKKKTLLAISCILALGVVGCNKDSQMGNASEGDGRPLIEHFTGEEVTVGEPRTSFDNLLILNEGMMGSNNASLDFFNPPTGQYILGAYMTANSRLQLGDTANDLLVLGDEIWIAVTGSDLVEVVDASTLIHKLSIPVTMPRYLATDGLAVYVTSYNGAYTVYTYNPEMGYSEITDYKNPKGAVLKIDARTKRAVGQITVGYQPEGIAITKSGYMEYKLVVANSGGIASQLPPDYSYDNTISEIDLKSFSLSGTSTGVINAKEIFIDSKGDIWEHTLGNYDDVHSGLYKITSTGAERVTTEGCFLCAGIIAKDGDDFWILGTDDEYDWEKTDKTYYVYKITDGVATKVNVPISATYPYGIAVDPDTKDLYITDGGTGGNLGTITCYSASNGYSKKWSTTTGVFPGHFLFL